MKSEELQENILSTYFTLRGGIVILSVALPCVLAVGGEWRGVGLLDSLSAYYGADDGLLRNWFVGTLWTVGTFLFLYRGFTVVENVVLNFAGGFAVAVAMIPCNCWSGAIGPVSRLHSFCAVSFFLSTAFVCLSCAGETLSLLPDEATRTKFKRRYGTIGVLLVLTPLLAVSASYLLDEHANWRFFIEAFGVWVFAGYWAVKSCEFRITSAEELAARGKLKKVVGKGLIRVD